MPSLSTLNKPTQSGRSSIQDSATITFLDNLLRDAVDRNIADIHFESQDRTVIVRLRLDGLLYDVHSLDYFAAQPVLSRVKVLANLDISEYNTPQDGRFTYFHEQQEVDCRVSCLPTVQGESVVIRLLNKNKLFPAMETLGMLPNVAERFKTTYSQTQGMLLVTGPTGSGKTTTLYSVLHALQSPEKKLITVEDPVEYSIPDIIQVPVNYAIDVSFGRCVRSFLRQDPDVILVGEIRDGDTAQIAARAALTGHLVLSTLHTPDTASVFDRLADLGLPSFLSTAALSGVLAQRLIRINCTRCLSDYTPSEAIRARFPAFPEKTLSKSVGCDYCQYSGFLGRKGIFEFLKMTDTLKNLVAKERSRATIHEQAVAEGMVTLAEAGLYCARQGQTTLEEIIRVI